MEMVAQVTLKCNWKIGEVTFNEIAYRTAEMMPDLARKLLEHLVQVYQEEVTNRLRPGHTAQQRAGLGRHTVKGQTGKLCNGRTVRRHGYRWHHRGIKSRCGTVQLKLQEVECLTCGRKYAPVLDALRIAPYQRHDEVIEQAVIEAVTDTNYRRVITGHGLDISLGGVHDYIAGSDVDKLVADEVDLDRYHGVLADGTGLNEQGGKRGELRVLVGITTKGRLEPIGSWTDTSWKDIEHDLRQRIKGRPKRKPYFGYDGEPGLEDFLPGYFFGTGRCNWHAPRGLYHALWTDGHKQKTSQPWQEALAKIIAVSIPAKDYDKLSPKTIEAVRAKYQTAKKELDDLVDVLRQQNCTNAVTYLENLLKGVFKHVELWLATGIVAPKTTSRLERLFRELGRRLKNIAWGWSDRIATKLSKMIMIKTYCKEEWQKYWLDKMGIRGCFSITLESISITPCLNF